MRWYLRLHPGWLAGVLCACWQRRIVLWLFARPAIYAMMCVGGGYGVVVGVMALLPEASEQAEPEIASPGDAVRPDEIRFQNNILYGNVCSGDTCLHLPFGDCSHATGNGQLCYDSDDGAIYVGNGSEGIRLETVGIETKSIHFPPYAFIVTEGQCAYNWEGVDNINNSWATVTCPDVDGAYIATWLETPSDFDGEHVQIQTMIKTISVTPSGDIALDWMAFCYPLDAQQFERNFPFKSAEGKSVLSLNVASRGDAVMAKTGSIPLRDCEGGGAKRMMLKAEIDAVNTTTLDMENQHFIGFRIDYGVR